MRLDNRLTLVASDKVPAGHDDVVVQGSRYRFLASGRFFEWLFSADDQVLGVELRLSDDDDLLQDHSYLRSLPYMDFGDMFPRVWFTTRTDGRPRNLHDWEDYYYESTDRRLMVAVRTHLLTPDQLDSLKKICVASAPPQ